MCAEKTCLIVDDSEIIREIADRIIADLGLGTAQARNAAAAVGYCRDHKPAGVLLDWDLPSMGALDFLKGASELPEEDRPAIILCATENDPQQFTLARAAGAAFHVLKPFDKNSLKRALIEAGLVEGEGASRKTSAA